MSKTYIRIYCNDTKVRATGSEKWYRKMVLSELFLDEKLKLNLDETDKYEEKINRLYDVLTTYSIHTHSADKYIFKVELVRSTTMGKRILESITLPWVHHSDGTFSLLPEYDT